MTPTEFEALKYGNVILDSNGHKFLVLHTMRTPTGQVIHAGIVPAIGVEEATGYTVLGRQFSETMITVAGATIGKLEGTTSEDSI